MAMVAQDQIEQHIQGRRTAGTGHPIPVLLKQGAGPGHIRILLNSGGGILPMGCCTVTI